MNTRNRDRLASIVRVIKQGTEPTTTTVNHDPFIRRIVVTVTNATHHSLPHVRFHRRQFLESWLRAPGVVSATTESKPIAYQRGASSSGFSHTSKDEITPFLDAIER